MLKELFLISGLLITSTAQAQPSISLTETEQFYNLDWAQLFLTSASDKSTKLEFEQSCADIDLANRHLSETLKSSTTSDAFGTPRVTTHPELRTKFTWKDDAARKEANRLAQNLGKSLPGLIKDCYLMAGDHSISGIFSTYRYETGLNNSVRDIRKIKDLIFANVKVETENYAEQSTAELKVVPSSISDGQSSESQTSGRVKVSPAW